jgi:hypothetical protein
VRVTGLFLAGVLASTTPTLAHAVSLGSDVEHLGPMRAAGFTQVWDGGGWAGIWYPVIGASGAGYVFRRIALPTVIPVPGLPMVVGEVPTAVEEPPYGGWRPYGTRLGSYEGSGGSGGG